MFDSEWKRISLYGTVLGLALVLAGVYVAGEQGRRKDAVLQNGETIVWTGDTEALHLLRENGVVAVGSGSVYGGKSGTARNGADPYHYLHAGGSDGKEKQPEEIRTSGESGAEKEKAKIVYLTFDDGPSRNTGKILDILAAYQAKATFFVIGENLTDTGIETVRRAVAEGHLLGMHTDCHQYGKIYASAEAFLEDYDRLAKRFVDEFGVCPSCFRFPGGSCSRYINPIREQLKQELKERGFACYDWNVSGEDSVGTPTAASIRKNIFGRIYEVDEPILLLHDSPCNGLTVEVLPQILERLTEEGYEFRTLETREPYEFPW